MEKFVLNLFGQETPLEVSRQGNTFHVTHDDESAELTLIYRENNSFILQWKQPNGDLKRLHVAGTSDGDNRQIWVNGQTFTYDRLRQRGGAATFEGSLSSSIPAVVTQILVSPGDKVSAGEKLLLLESMKMIIPIQAPFEGLIKAVHCRAGDSVQAGVTLIDIEEES